MTLPLLFVTAIALIDGDDRVLLAQRPAGKDMAGLWEFPGGKVNAHETPEQALIREMKEELNITVATCDLQPLTFASHAYEKFHLFMPLYVCRVWQGEPHPQEDQQIEWVRLKDFGNYPMPPADGPLAKILCTSV